MLIYACSLFREICLAYPGFYYMYILDSYFINTFKKDVTLNFEVYPGVVYIKFCISRVLTVSSKTRLGIYKQSS